MLVSLLATGILTQPELAGLKVPSMAGVFESIVGSWGAALINIGLMVSVGGAFLSWSLLCAEIPYTCGSRRHVPQVVRGRERQRLAQERALGDEHHDPALPGAQLLFEERVSVLLLHCLGRDPAPLCPVGRLCAKLALTGDGYGSGESRTRDIVIGAAATIYGLWLVYAAGLITC